MKKFFILLMVVLMLAGLASTSFAGNGPNYWGDGAGYGDQIRIPGECK